VATHDTLGKLGLGWPYRAAVAGCAGLVASNPSLERSFVRVSRALWQTPVAGRLCRSVGYRLVDRLRGTGNVYRDIEVDGIRLRVDATHWMFSGQYLGGVAYEPDTAGFIRGHLRPGMVFVDIGANSGFFSLLAAHYVGAAGRVFAFEPNPPVFAALTQHVELNHLADRIRAFDVALSDTASDAARLHVWPEHSGFSSLDLEGAPGAEHLAGGSSVTIRTEVFDRWFAEQDLASIDLLKMDVEGFEGQVVSGMTRTLSERRIARIVCETPWDSPAHRQLLAHGYRAERLEAVGGMDNIVYTSPTAGSDPINEQR
jgi:FkbM family methyltransferase